MAKSSLHAVPNQLAQFEIVRRLGAGGMAEVFLAKKRGAEGTFKLLVVKRILPTHGTSRRFRTMFVEEAQLATRLNHPNVVQVYEFFDGGDEGQLLAMEFVEGPDLGMLMSSAKAKGTRVPPWVGAWIIAEAAKGLHYAHEKKDEGGAPLEIVHRDVSPQNVLLSFEGGVKIADFGIASAKLFVEEQGVLKGKFGYMSPEQARGEKVDRRSDLYALGVILWEVLTGRPIHGGLGGEALLDIVRSGYVEPPSTYREVPAELEAIVMKALEPRKEDRFATGRELASAISRALLVKQELVDAATLETTLTQLVARENTRPGSNAPSDAPPPPSVLVPDAEAAPNRTQAAVPFAKSVVELDATRSRGTSPRTEPPPRPSIAPAGPREVRHVAVVTLKITGIDELAVQDGALAERTVDRVRTMLGDIAYKRGMRLWIWMSDTEAHSVAGLTANPAHAAIDAATLALETHELVETLSEDLPVTLAASIGIVRGIASGTRDPQGNLIRYRLHDPVSYLAQVIGQATPPNRTWVAGGVYRLVRRDFRWGDAPTLKLEKNAAVENVPPTMRIYALERSLSREERVAELLHASSDLVGRDTEKADLHSAYHQAVIGGGAGGAVTCRAVVGEMGIGKTALASTFIAELPPNTRVVRVECSPVKQEVPFNAVAELLRDTLGITGEEPFEDVVNILARAGGGSAQGDATHPMLARMAELATNKPLGGSGEDDPHYLRKMLTTGLRMLLAAIAMESPLVVLVEGLQWADKQSQEVLTEFLKIGDPLPILILLLSRTDDRALAPLEGVVRIELRGLSTDEQVRLVETRLGVREGVRQVCADLLPRVGGNPFFLLEMVDALLERGTLEIKEVVDEQNGEPKHVLARTDRAGEASLSLPSTLEQLLGDRLRELPDEEHTVIDWLAIAGGPLAVGDLAELTHVPTNDAIMRLCARGLCDRRGDHLDFRHPLTRDVAYLALDTTDRVAMHRALGAHLGKTALGRGISAAIVARHLARGDASAEAAFFYLEAADAARAGNQTQLAVRYYNRALACLPPTDLRRIHAHEALETIFRFLGRRRDRIKHLDALRKMARRAATPKACCLALLRIARFDLDEGRLAKGLPVARRAAEVSHSRTLANFEIEAEALVSELLRELGDVQGALAACDRALAACNPNVNRNVPPRARAEVLRSRGVLLRRVGRVREAVDAYVDSIAVFRRVGARRQEARAKNTLAFAMFCQGRYEDAIALAIEAIQIDLSIGGRFQLANTLTNIGHAYARIGDSARAKAYLQRARDSHERYGDQDGRADTLTVSAELAIELRDFDAAEAFLADAAALNEATDNAYDKTHEAVTRAQLARVNRDPRAAIAYALEARHQAEAQALVSFHFYAFAIEASARVDVGEIHAATLLATTALGAVETLQGCEYGLDIRVLCADALKRAGSPQAAQAHQRAIDHAAAQLSSIREARYRRMFVKRPNVAALLDATPIPAIHSPGTL